MAKGWATAEHVGHVTISILDVLAKEFHKANAKGEDKDHALLIKLSQAVGYQSQLYSGLQKSIEYAKRLEEVEKVVQHASAEDLALGQSPVLQAEDELKKDEAFR
jgi:hypothetical protein